MACRRFPFHGLALWVALGAALAQDGALEGRWVLNANGYTFLLELDRAGGQLGGSLSPLNSDNPVTRIDGEATAEGIRFTRAAHNGWAAQRYEGRLVRGPSGPLLTGTFVHEGAGGYRWCAIRATARPSSAAVWWPGCDPEPAAPPRPAPVQVRIEAIQVRYTGWEAERNFLETELGKAQRELDAAEASFRSRQETARRFDGALAELERERGRLEPQLVAGLASSDPAEASRKTPEYRALERQAASIRTRLVTIDSRLDSLGTDGDGTPPALALPLLEEHHELRGRLAGLEDGMSRLDEVLGIRPLRERRVARARAAEDRYWKVRREALRLEGDRGTALALRSHDVERMESARADRNRARAALAGLMAGGRPLVTAVSNEWFSARLWSPTDELARLDLQIAELSASLKATAELRRSQREALLAAGEELTRKSRELVDGIWASLAAQATVELVDLGKDLYEGGAKYGLAGVALTVTRKALEATVFGPPSLIDAEYEASDPLAAQIEDGPATLAKRIAKTALSHPFKVALQDAVVRRERSVLASLERELVKGSWFTEAMKGHDPKFLEKYLQHLPALVSEQAASLREAESKLAESLGGHGRAALGKSLAAGFLKGLLRDVGKKALKTLAADTLEGGPLRSYMLAQFKMAGYARLLLQTSNHFWMVQDLLVGLDAARTALIEGYDPESQMFFERNELARLDPAGDGYRVEVSDAGRDPRQSTTRKYRVYVGGAHADRAPSGALVFTVPPARLPGIGPQDAVLRIEVDG